jgi:subfamily B ATP-binding cassette protein MsbA
LFGVTFSVLNLTLLVPILDVIFSTETEPVVVAVPAFSFSAAYFKAMFYHYFYLLRAEHGAMGALQFTCAIIVISVFLANFFKYFAQRTITKMQSFIIRNLRRALFDKILSLHIAYFRTITKGQLLSMVSNDINEIQSVVGSSLQIILREPLLILAYAIALFYMSPQLTIFTLIVLPVTGLIIAKIASTLRKSAKQAQTLLGNLLGIMDESIVGIRIIKIFKAEKYIGKKFDELNNQHRKTFKRMWNRTDIASPLSEFLGILAVVCIVLYGGSLIFKGSADALTASQFIAYIAIFSQILTPAKALAQASANFQRGIASGERVFNIIDAKVEIKNAPNAKKIEQFSHSIAIKNMSFAYVQDWVLKNINLEVKKGQMVALVGQSGSGKTTLANLIPRFYEVVQGEIVIDGENVKNYDLSSLYNQISMVTQDAILFNDTVYNNIVFGMSATKEQVVEAAKIANAHEFIMEMEEGYQTNVGDAGGRLSGGQRQRIAIARAVLKNPPILILDEATSALDTESEKLVQDALTKLMKNRTSIVIAHRLSTIQNADCIVVLQKGEIVEQGTHEALVAKSSGVYKHLCELQAFK